MNTYYIGKYTISDGCKPIRTKVKVPIEWKTIDTVNDKTLLISSNIIDWEMYDECDKEIVWTDSYMYEYLSKLYQDMFSSEEKDVIKHCEYGNLFLLSEAEIVDLLSTEEQRRAVIYYTSQKEKGEIELNLEHHDYWLRVEGSCDCEDVPIVNSLGKIVRGYSDADEIGIRPAMWVDTKAARILTAKNGYNKWHHSWLYEDF